MEADPTPEVKATENGGGRGRSRAQVDALNAARPSPVYVVQLLLPLDLSCVSEPV